MVDQKQPGGDASQLRALAQPLLEVKFTPQAPEAKQERPHGHFSGLYALSPYLCQQTPIGWPSHVKPPLEYREGNLLCARHLCLYIPSKPPLVIRLPILIIYMRD